MYLKSLEVVGFKSFADPTKIEFHRGVTCVVGPNGCGKSNVLDAIRWVLGEQSAKALRGGSMQDVIFSGTDSRKAFGMAEVAMTFAECEEALGQEYHEVRIARRVFRDGHGEYEINKTPCRLRDIHRLFMDTGIGRSAYSIMEQGKIDQILSSKPEERRAVFEEAAGITRFKTQKKEALRKLDATESNLIRVSDIIKEVNRQIGSLQRQANKARRYQELFDRLKLLDTHLASNQFKQWQEKIESGESRHQALQLEFDALQNAVVGREGQLEEKRKSLEEARARHLHAERESALVRSAMEKAEQTIDFNRRRLEELDENRAASRKDIVEAEEKIAIQSEQEKAGREEARTVESEHQQIRGELEQQQGAMEEIARQVEAQQNERARWDQELGQTEELLLQARNRLAGFEARRTSYEAQLNKWQEGDRELDERNRAAREAVQVAASQLEAIREERAVAEGHGDDADAEVARCETEWERAKEAQAEAQAAVHRVSVRVDALEHVLKGSDSLQSMQDLMERMKGRGLRGSLLNYMEVREGYETAIEACLGKATEALVFDDPASLDEAGRSIPEGEEAVLALDVPESGLRRFFERTPAESALHYVTARDGASHLLKRLLKSFVVADSEEDVPRLRSAYPGHHVVARDGQVWYREGWERRGRQTGSGRSLVQHRHELQHLQEKSDSLQRRAQEADGEVARCLESLNRARMDAEARHQALKDCSARLSEAEMELRSAQRDAEDAEKRIAQRERDQQDLRSGIEEGEKSIATARQEVASLEQSRRDLQGRLEAGLKQLHRQESELESYRQAVSDVRVREAGVLQRLKSIRGQAETISARLQELRSTCEQRQAQLAEIARKEEACRSAIHEAESQIERDRSRIEHFAVEQEQLTAECSGLEEAVADLDRQVREGRQKASEVQSQFGKEEVAVAQFRMKADTLAERVRRAYQIDLHQWEPGQQLPRTREDLQLVDIEPVEGRMESDLTEMDEWIVADRPHRRPQDEPLLQGEAIDWTAVESEIESLRERIERMGPVNVEAITEYAELEERQRFLQHQEEDLIVARDRLHEAIRKINQTTRELFADTFERIQKNFSEMFQELFGGGKATLSLDDDSDPLESGIEIVARPPGKQLQSITLLSGGERTMTAVALMFSIYMVKPSPFCFLDEMDAPLDESNINRFIRILQRFVQQSQFCVITHNKRTISAADVIYGVTMQEHGISRVVSVKLDRKGEDPLFDDEDITIADSVRQSAVRSPS